jgi:hypothetical protein
MKRVATNLAALVFALVVLACALVPHACAVDAPPSAEAQLKAAQQDARLAKLEALVLREQLATQQLEKLRAEQQALYGETCRAAGIELNVCAVDLSARTVTRRDVAAKPETK